MTSNGFTFSSDRKTLLSCDFSKLGTDIIVPDGVQKISNAVFAESNAISISIPNSVTELGQNVFSSAESLETITLSDNISALEPFTFSGCFSLTNVSIPQNVKTFPEGLFLGCSSLTKIPFCKDLSQFDSLEVDVFRDCENLQTIQIPPNVKTIKIGALSGCTNLSEIVFPSSLETIQDRSLANLKSLTKMSFDKTCNNFFIDQDFKSLYQITTDGTILIKATSDTTSIKLQKDTYDIHIDAFDSCPNLQEIYLYENAPEEFINKIMELFPAIDINSYNDEFIQEDFSNLQKENIESENLQQAESYIATENISTDNSTFEKAEEIQANTKSENFEIDVNSILNDQCCRNDSLDEGYRPVTMDELEALFSNPVYHDQLQNDKQELSESKKTTDSKKEKKTSTKKRKSKDSTKDSSTSDSQEKTKRTRKSKSKNNESKIESTDCIAAQEPDCTEDNDEPRFIKALKSISAHQLILDQQENAIESVYGNLKDLFVFADGVAPSTNEFSSHLVKFAKAVAKKYGFTKIYFFNDLPLDNPEFIYGLESFGNFRNVLYACDKANKSSISDAQKELILASGIELPKKDFINVKQTLDNNTLQYPIKILVQDNYIEGLLYCAEKYREAHGIK